MASAVTLPRLQVPPAAEQSSHITDTLKAIQELTQQGSEPLDDYDKSRFSRWLSKLIDGLENSTEPAEIRILDDASIVLARLLASSSVYDEDATDARGSLLRTFSFPYRSPLTTQAKTIHVAIQDLTSVTIGAQTWNSAPVLAKRICSCPEMFFGRLLDYFQEQVKTHLTRQADGIGAFRVLEIGAGTGLVGIVAACVLQQLLTEMRQIQEECQIAVEIILTDYASDVLDNLRANVEINKDAYTFAGDKSQCSLDLTVTSLDWANLDDSSVQDYFDVILGSDLVYEIDHADWSARAVKRFLKRLGSAFDSLPASPYSSGTATPISSHSSTPIISKSSSPLSRDLAANADAQLGLLPIFHLLLPLRPTFARESQAVHAAYGGTFEASNEVDLISLPVRKGRRKRRSTLKGSRPIYDRTLGIYRCQQLEGVAHGQGCRDYQLLTIGWL